MQPVLVLLLSGEGISRHLCFVSSMCEKLAWVHRFLHLTSFFVHSDYLFSGQGVFLVLSDLCFSVMWITGIWVVLGSGGCYDCSISQDKEFWQQQKGEHNDYSQRHPSRSEHPW